jgi:hypothetical protein
MAPLIRFEGEEISIGTRILGLLACLDALVFRAPTQAAFSRPAKQCLKWRWRPKRFNPSIVLLERRHPHLEKIARRKRASRINQIGRGADFVTRIIRTILSIFQLSPLTPYSGFLSQPTPPLLRKSLQVFRSHEKYPSSSGGQKQMILARMLPIQAPLRGDVAQP